MKYEKLTHWLMSDWEDNNTFCCDDFGNLIAVNDANWLFSIKGFI